MFAQSASEALQVLTWTTSPLGCGDERDLFGDLLDVPFREGAPITRAAPTVTRERRLTDAVTSERASVSPLQTRSNGVSIREQEATWPGWDATRPLPSRAGSSGRCSAT